MRGSRFVYGVFFAFSVIVSAVCGLMSTVLSPMLDWTLFGVAMVCIMPALCLLDVCAIVVLTWAALRLKACTTRRENKLVRLSTLGLLHLVTAGLAVLLLAVPASSIWTNGLSLSQMRSVFVALSVLSLLLALELPCLIVNTMITVLRTAAERD